MTGTAKTRLAKGAWLSGRGSLAVATAIVLTIIAMGLTAVAEERPLSAWRLDEWGKWTGLPEVNPYATIAGSGSSQGWGNSGASIGVTARAVFEPDLSRAEISAEFVPVSRGIITSDSRLFIAPLRQRLEWKAIVTVRNPNDVSMTNVRVHNQFGKAFRATLTGQSVGDARMADAEAKGLLPSSSGFTWDIGYLGPGAAAKAELTVTTNQAGGRAEFAEEGVYSLDTGFRLVYRLLGEDEVRNTAPCSVIARVNPSALRSDAEPYSVQQRPVERDFPLPERPIPQRPIPGRPGTEQPIVTQGPGQRSPAVITRVAPELSAEELAQLEAEEEGAKGIDRHDGSDRFTVTATAKTTNIKENAGEFVVPAGEYAEWEVDLAVLNSVNALWITWTATLEFGPELKAEVTSHSIVTYANVTEDPVTGTTRVAWGGVGLLRDLGDVARLRVFTRNPNGCTTPGNYVFTDSLEFQYRAPRLGWPPYTEHGFSLSPIRVDVEAVPEAAVSLSATRLDWRVRKPGTYAALATEITATGYGKLSIQFSEFGDPVRSDGTPGTVDAFYGFGATLAVVEAEGWVRADMLNGASRVIDLSSPMPVWMWSMIGVGEEDSSTEYESKGVITFIVSNN